MRNFLIATVLSLNALSGFGQLKEVKVGEPVPNVSITNIMNYPKSSVKISDFANKLLILDFWATWCKPCLASFPKIDSLQKEFGSQIQILPVATEDSETVNNLLERLHYLKNLKLPSVIHDRVLRKLFPHVVVPHCVWINGEGRVVAITEGEEVTKENIAKVLEGKMAHLPVKHDARIIFSDRQDVPSLLPAYKIQRGADTTLTSMDNSKLLIQSVLTGYLDGFSSGSSNRDSTLVSVWNSSILQLFSVALWKHGGEILNESLTIADVKDSALLKKLTLMANGKPLFNREDGIAWMAQNDFCYEVKVPPALAGKKFDIMLEELNRYFGSLYGIEGVKEKRMLKYLALVRTSNEDKLATKGGTPVAKYNAFWVKLQNATIAWLPTSLRIPLQLYPPIEDETGYTNMVDIELNCQLNDLNALNKELAKYGLQLVEKEKMRDIAVVRLKK
jgi:thiol-disulfide isomerase/thioredoxin